MMIASHDRITRISSQRLSNLIFVEVNKKTKGPGWLKSTRRSTEIYSDRWHLLTVSRAKTSGTWQTREETRSAQAILRKSKTANRQEVEWLKKEGSQKTIEGILGKHQTILTETAETTRSKQLAKETYCATFVIYGAPFRSDTTWRWTYWGLYLRKTRCSDNNVIPQTLWSL